MTKILSLDEAFDELENGGNSFKPSSKTKTSNIDAALIDENETVNRRAKRTRNDYEMNRDAVSGPTGPNNRVRIAQDTRFVLNHYINKIPDVKILDHQIKVIKEEMVNYKKSGNVEATEKSKILLADLTEKRKVVDKIFKRKEYSVKDSADKESARLTLKNDETYVNLTNRKKELRKQLELNTPSALVDKLSRLKTLFVQSIALNAELDNEQPLDLDLDEELDLDELISDIEKNMNTKNLEELEQDYNDLLYHIGTVTGLKKTEILSMNNYNIKLELTKKLKDTNKYIKENLMQVDIEIASRKSELTNKVSVTDILFKTVDYKDESSEKISKDILAASNVGLVTAIATQICKSQGRLHELDEAICGGLYGLSKGINKWYTLQSALDQPFSFENFANIHISNEVKKALYAVSGIYGTSGQNKATIDTQNKRKKEEFLKYNPNFKDIDPDIIEDLLMNIEPEMIEGPNGEKIKNKHKLKATFNVTHETDYNATVGGDEGGVDMYEINDFGSRNEFDFMEAQEQYKKLLQTISRFLDLFETKTDSLGNVIQTEKKLFDKYDRKILMMLWGFDHKKVADPTDPSKDSIKVTYSQKERLNEINAMFRANNVIDHRNGGKIKSLTQPALSDREKVLEKKMKVAIENDNELKSALAYMFSYYRDSDNKQALVQLSNYREELNISLDREALKEIYADNKQVLDIELTDGKKLSDIYEVSETNPLEDEIAGMFSEF